MSSVVNRFVLVVDDQPAVADTLALVLRQARYMAVSCYNASDALAICRTVVPDIMLVEVVLDRISGIDVAIAARALARNCRIILMSGNNITEEMIAHATESVSEFPLLAKPIPPKDLLAVLADGEKPCPGNQ